MVFLVKEVYLIIYIKQVSGRHLGGSVVEHLPLAQVMIPEPWDRVPHRAFWREPAFPSAMSLSLSLFYE